METSPRAIVRNGLIRTLDVSIPLLASVVVVPVVATLALLVLCLDGPPVFWRQRRTGLHGQIFMLWKFRTMSDQRDESGRLLDDSARLTRLGSLLRALSLDELPQLWNVLRGEMSLVGPRPLLPEYLPLYTSEQYRRHGVKPGVTGWAQVNGRNTLTWEQKFRLDVWYVDHKSLALDLKILFLTLWKVIRRDGISQQGHATMPSFTGSREEIQV